MPTLRDRLLDRLWYVQPAASVTVHATPPDCLRALAEAAKPNLNRLHLRNLFADGRRYHLDPQKDGFSMTSNSKIPWRRRARTGIAAVVEGELQPAGEGWTRVHMRARMRLLYFLDIFWIPLFMSSLLIFAPWQPLVITGLIVVLFSLSWISHRLTATLQAADIVYFVRIALEDIAPGATIQMGAGEPDLVTQNGEFHQQWEKFYEEHKGES